MLVTVSNSVLQRGVLRACSSEEARGSEKPEVSSDSRITMRRWQNDERDADTPLNLRHEHSGSHTRGKG